MKWRIKYNPICYGSYFNLYHHNWLCWALSKLFAAHIFARKSRSHQKVSAAVFSRGKLCRGKIICRGFSEVTTRRGGTEFMRLLITWTRQLHCRYSSPSICHPFRSCWVSFSLHYLLTCAVMCGSLCAEASLKSLLRPELLVTWHGDRKHADVQ